jgi:hypothetical protein
LDEHKGVEHGPFAESPAAVGFADKWASRWQAELMSEEPQRWPFGKVTSLLLVWNGLGALLVLCFVCAGLYVDLTTQYRDKLNPPLPVLLFVWCCWFPSLPFTTLGVAVVLWRCREVAISRRMMLFSGMAVVLWVGMIVATFASLGGFES